MYFILDDRDYHGEQSDIGEIIRRFNLELYRQTGLVFATYMGPTSEEITAYFKDKGFESLNEEILWKNMTISERIDKFVEYIERIDGVEGHLLIIDPYLFPRKCDKNYPKMLVQIFNKANCVSITVVTDESNYNKSIFETVSQDTESPIKVIFSSDFHDRYWIANEKKGFNCGTSMNGVGRKISSILMLEDDDVRDIVQEVKNIM